MKNLEECNKVMDIYLGLDKGERVPFSATMHLLTCRKCRRQVRMLKSAENLARKPLEVPVPIDDESILSVMSKIDPNYNSSKNPISISMWIIAGITMILFMLIFGLSRFHNVSEIIMISFYIIFAVAVTVYCSMFIGTNMDFFVKIMKTKKLS
ncbi:MAG: hypothetical protein ACI4LX_08610 [Treponema sp.]